MTTTAAPPAVERLEWAEARRRFVRDWKQGEHVSMLAPTGWGKDVIGLSLLQAVTDRSEHVHAVVLASKPRDATLDAMRSRGWKLTRAWPASRYDRRVLLWPNAPNHGRVTPVPKGVLRIIFGRCLHATYVAGRWVLYVSEIRTLTQRLGLKELTEQAFTEGRSNGQSLWSCTQRPAFVPLEFYTEATWMLMGRTSSKATLRRVVDHCGAANAEAMAAVLPRLERYEFLVAHRVTGELWVTKVDAETAALFG